jgi:hypothetical protein
METVDDFQELLQLCRAVMRLVPLRISKFNGY